MSITNKLATAALAGLLTASLCGGAAFAAEGTDASATTEKAVEKHSCKGAKEKAEKASCKGVKKEKHSCKGKSSCKGKKKAETAPADEAPAEEAQ